MKGEEGIHPTIILVAGASQTDDWASHEGERLDRQGNPVCVFCWLWFDILQ